MQFSAALLSAIAVAFASATTIEQRDVAFDVSSFSAACVEHSTQCVYSFSVLQPGSGETTGVSCSASVTSNTDGTLPDIPKYGGTCQGSSRTFWVTRGASGLDFSVSQQVSRNSNRTGSHLIPNSDLQIVKGNTGSTQKYTGPTSFTLST